MQLDHLLHKLHLLVHRKFHAAEYAGNHLGADVVVIMESPAQLGIVTLGHGLGYVVEYRSPAQPQVVALGSQLVEHGQCMVEVVLVSATVDGLNPFQGVKLGKDYRQQSTFFKQKKAYRRALRSHHLVHLVDNALARDYLDALPVARYGIESLIDNAEAQLRGKADGPHHAPGGRR